MRQFTWQELLSLLDLPYKPNTEYRVVCPRCAAEGKNDKKMYLNSAKEVFYCHRHGEGGRKVALYAFCHNITQEDAKRELFKLSNSHVSPMPPRLHPVANKTGEKEQGKKEKSERQSIENIDCVYRNMIKMLSLSNAHRNHLKLRGLSDQQIDYFCFRSTPKDSIAREKIVRNLARKHNLLGIPGFYEKENGDLGMMPVRNGLMIPVLSADKNVLCFQIRNMNPKAETRYFAFSSTGKKMLKGCGPETYVHHVGDRFGRQDASGIFFLTEGALKADVASALSHKPFLAVLGVNSLRYLPEALQNMKKKGYREAHICYDMDKKDNKEVLKAEKKVVKMVIVAGLIPKICEWDQGKGIDDYLLMCKSKKAAGI